MVRLVSVYTRGYGMKWRVFLLILGLGLLAEPKARADLLLPGQPFAGRTQAEWSAVWWC